MFNLNNIHKILLTFSLSFIVITNSATERSKHIISGSTSTLCASSLGVLSCHYFFKAKESYNQNNLLPWVYQGYCLKGFVSACASLMFLQVAAHCHNKIKNIDSSTTTNPEK